MSLNPDTQAPESPPTYTESGLTNDVWEPTILVLNKTTIHRESTTSPALYRLSRAVSAITAATKIVEFERIEHTVKTKLASNDLEPVVKPRSRHIYNLRYWRRPTGLSALIVGWTVPDIRIQSVSRSGTLGHLGLKRPRFQQKTELKVYPMDISGDVVSWLPSSSKNTKPVFQIQRKDGKSTWKDGDNRVIATEDLDGEDQHKLIITVSLHQEIVDALVALWCALIWQHSNQNIDEGLDGGKL